MYKIWGRMRIWIGNVFMPIGIRIWIIFKIKIQIRIGIKSKDPHHWTLTVGYVPCSEGEGDRFVHLNGDCLLLLKYSGNR